MKKNSNNIFLIGGFVVFIGTIFLSIIDKIENLPTFFVSVVALGFTHLSYYNSREKFRLDLFDKRYEIYRNSVEFCKYIIRYGGLPDAEKQKDARRDFESIVNQSFQRDGDHLATFLFGDDIADLYNKFNKIYAFFSTYSINVIREISDPEERNRIQLLKFEHLKYLNDIVTKMPDIFSKYMNFSKFKIFP